MNEPAIPVRIVQAKQASLRKMRDSLGYGYPEPRVRCCACVHISSLYLHIFYWALTKQETADREKRQPHEGNYQNWDVKYRGEEKDEELVSNTSCLLSSVVEFSPLHLAITIHWPGKLSSAVFSIMRFYSYEEAIRENGDSSRGMMRSYWRANAMFALDCVKL